MIPESGNPVAPAAANDSQITAAMHRGQAGGGFPGPEKAILGHFWPNLALLDRSSEGLRRLGAEPPTSSRNARIGVSTIRIAGS